MPGGLLPAVPPERVALADLPEWVARWFRLRVDTVAAELAEAVWTGALRDAHRIRGVTLRFNRSGIKAPPPGIDWRRRYWGGGVVSDDWFVATDWEVAGVDRRTGTVGGWPQEDGARERLPVEVPWAAAKDFAALRVRGWARREAAPTPPADRDAQAEATAPTPPTAAEWMVAHAKDQLAAIGQPAKRDDAIAECRYQTRCTWRQALAAWQALPANLKRPLR